MKLSLMGWLTILSTTWLTKNFVDPDLKRHFFLLPKWPSRDFSTNALDLVTLGPFQSSVSSVLNFWNLQFLWGFVCNSATLPIDSMTDSFGVLQKTLRAIERNCSFCLWARGSQWSLKTAPWTPITPSQPLNFLNMPLSSPYLKCWFTTMIVT